jgi:hypothetical protein
VHIERDVDEVYAYLKDLEHTPEWNWAIEETKKVSEGPIEVGTRFHQTRSVPTNSSEELEITALEEGEVIEVAGKLAQFDAQLAYRLEPDAAGTLVENEVHLDAPGALRLVDGVLTGRIRDSVASNLNDLKTRLETESRGQA